MIDFHALKFGEKFIAYVLENESPMRQQQIIDMFGINEGHLRTILKSLVNKKIATKFANENNVVLYRSTDAQRPSTDAQRRSNHSDFVLKKQIHDSNKQRKKGILQPRHLKLTLFCFS